MTITPRQQTSRDLIAEAFLKSRDPGDPQNRALIEDTHVTAWVPKATAKEIIFVYESINWDHDSFLKIYASAPEKIPAVRAEHFVIMSMRPISSLDMANKSISPLKGCHKRTYQIPSSLEVIAALGARCRKNGSLANEVVMKILCSDGLRVHVANDAEIYVDPLDKVTGAQVYPVLRV